MFLFTATCFGVGIDREQAKKRSHWRAGSRCNTRNFIMLYMGSSSFTLFCFTIKL